MNLNEYEKLALATKYAWVDNSLRLFSCFLLPGGGQFYNNEPMKGIPILALGSWLGHLYFEKREKNKELLPAIGISLLYLGAAFEAFYSVKSGD